MEDPGSEQRNKIQSPMKGEDFSALSAGDHNLGGKKMMNKNNGYEKSNQRSRIT